MQAAIRPIGAPAMPNNMGMSTNNGVDHRNHSMPGQQLNRPFRARRPFKHNPNKEFTMMSAKLSLEEAAKLEVDRQPKDSTKTPLNILHELLTRRGLKSEYELLPIEEDSTGPYRYQLVLNSNANVYKAIGEGKSKKEAKQNTAKVALNKLLGIKEEPAPVSKTTKPQTNGVASKKSGSSVNSSVAVIQEPNPISLLQESCFSRGWAPPYYDIVTQRSVSEPSYVINVYVDKYKESGTGKTKKLAKKDAAKKMVDNIKNIPQTTPNYKKLYEEAQSAEKTEMELEAIKKGNYVTMTPQQTKKVAQFHQKLKNNKGHKLDALKKNISNARGFDAVAYLEEIGKEQRFEITFVEIEDKSLSGDYQSLVQLATFPVAVCHGEGKTQKDAKIAAAHNAIEYLRLMTKSK